MLEETFFMILEKSKKPFFTNTCPWLIYVLICWYIFNTDINIKPIAEFCLLEVREINK